MCLAVPARITELLSDEMARVDMGGVNLTISLALLDSAEVDDYVIVHVGYALQKLDPQEAEQTLELLAESLSALSLPALQDDGA